MLWARCRYVSRTLPAEVQAKEGTRIQLCGRLSVEIGGVQLAHALRGRQVPLLLAYLLLNRDRYVGREELIGALWPFDAPRSQDAALRTLLSRLRSALGSSALAGRDELILTLPEPVWIDIEAAVVEVERAQQTLDHGDVRSGWALAQVPLNIAGRGLLPGSQANWLEPRRRELEDIRLRALEVIGRAALLMGGTQLASAERAARSLIEAEPYRESGYALLMEVLALQGNLAEGLRVYDRLRTLLRDELGTTPSAETIAVHERLLRPRLHPAGAPGPEGAPRANTVELPAELAARADTPLVGRGRELSELARAWAIARGELRGERSGRIVLLAGDPGIGKTRLAAELARNAYDQGACVLAGRAPEETLVPYQLFVETLRHYLLNAPSAELQVTAREYGSELARLIPELRRRAPDLTPPSVAEPETDRYRMFEAVVGLLSAISQRTPVLLVLDDLHWADRPTLLLLRHLARAPDPSRLLILGAYRSTESALEGFADALADLRRDRLISQIDVGGLSERETAELVATWTGEAPSSAFAWALHDETEGNPLFISEIVRHLAEAGVRVSEAGAGELQRFGLPEGVKQVIARRLTRLSAQATEWLRVAAVIGRDFNAALLERVVSLDEEEFLNALDEALAAGLVVETVPNAGRYGFSHALIRETLYEGMSAPRRARIHRRVGEELEATATGRRYINALAHHFTRAATADDGGKAITYAMRAGEQATAVLAHEEAAEHYARALEVLERFEPDALERRCELLLALGEARVRAGEQAAAGPAFRAAAELAERLGDSARLARAAIGASRRYVQQPGVIETDLIAMLDRALAATAGERTVTRVRLLTRLCGAIYYSPQRERMKALSAEASQLAQELDDPEAKMLACAARRRAIWDAAHLQERLAASTEMLTQARQARSLELELPAHAWLAVDLLEYGDREAVDAQMEAFAAGAERLRQPLFSWNAMLWRAMQALTAGQLDRAEELASEALAAGGPAEAVTAREYYAAQMLAVRREQGRMAELEAPVRQLVDINPTRPGWRAALATLLWESGRYPEAKAQLDVLAERKFTDIRFDGDWMTTVAVIADVAAELADVDRAGLLYELLAPYADRNVVVGLAALCLGSVASYLGKLAATLGHDREAAEHFERALVANARLRAPVCLAHTQVDYARALGSGPRAQELILTATRTAKQVGLEKVARRAGALPAKLTAPLQSGLPWTLPSPGS
jgi:DNA-binding SARP family transcriptional activator/tetratricopeptide (TPR) repeat protein